MVKNLSLANSAIILVHRQVTWRNTWESTVERNPSIASSAASLVPRSAAWRDTWKCTLERTLEKAQLKSIFVEWFNLCVIIAETWHLVFWPCLFYIHNLCNKLFYILRRKGKLWFWRRGPLDPEVQRSSSRGTNSFQTLIFKVYCGFSVFLRSIPGLRCFACLIVSL